jgi:hypothetical protein
MTPAAAASQIQPYPARPVSRELRGCARCARLNSRKASGAALPAGRLGIGELFPAEGTHARAVVGEVLEPCCGLLEARPKPILDPPHYEIRCVHLFEPVLAPAIKGRVHSLEDIALQVLGPLPNAEVCDDPWWEMRMLVELPLSSLSRHMKPGMRSASAFTRSRFWTNSVIRGSSKG